MKTQGADIFMKIFARKVVSMALNLISTILHVLVQNKIRKPFPHLHAFLLLVKIFGRLDPPPPPPTEIPGSAPVCDQSHSSLLKPYLCDRNNVQRRGATRVLVCAKPWVLTHAYVFNIFTIGATPAHGRRKFHSNLRLFFQKLDTRLLLG